MHIRNDCTLSYEINLFDFHLMDENLEKHDRQGWELLKNFEWRGTKNTRLQKKNYVYWRLSFWNLNVITETVGRKLRNLCLKYKEIRRIWKH